jgi:hypothetical protein
MESHPVSTLVGYALNDDCKTRGLQIGFIALEKLRQNVGIPLDVSR